MDEDLGQDPTIEVVTDRPGPDDTPLESELPHEPLWRRAIFGGGRSATMSSVVWILLGIGGLSLWCAFFAAVLSPAQEHRSQRNLYATIRSQIASQTVPTGGRIEPGTPIALLQLSGADDVLVVVEGTSARQLEDGPGHRRDTPLPGQIGVSVLMGRGLLFGAPFADVPDLKVGAIITVTTGEGTVHYRVEGARRAGDPGPVPILSPAGRLTLITSEGAGAGLGAIRRSVYVDAILIDPAQPPSEGRPTTINDNEASMRGDTGALPDLVGWLGALIVLVVVSKWLRERFGRIQTVIVCIPVLLALLWLAAESAAQLLPNLM